VASLNDKELSKYTFLHFTKDMAGVPGLYCCDTRCVKFEKMIDWGMHSLPYYIEKADAHIEKYHAKLE
jgi:hypothetical protein